jgi:hypothetical protein
MPASPEQPKKRTAKQSPDPAPPSDKPFLRFYHSESLRVKTLAVLETLEQAEDSTRHRAELSDIVVELTDAGLEYYFMRPLKLAEVGFVTEKSARIGMGTIKRVMSPVIRNIIGRMDSPQLLAVCGYIHELKE